MKTSSLGSKELYFRLLAYVRPYWKMLAASIGLLAVLAALEPVFPALMQPLLDGGFTDRDDKVIRWIPLAMVLLFLTRGAIGFAAKYASTWVASRVVTDLRQDLFNHSIHLPTNFFDQHSSGRLASHIANNPGAVTGAATTALTVLTRDSLTLVALMSWLIWLDWRLTVITLALFPFMAIIIRYFNKRMRKISRDLQHANADLVHSIEESVTNNRVVKSFTGEEFEKRRFSQFNERMRGLSMRGAVAESALTPLVQLLASMSVALVVAIALNREGANQTTAGEFMSFLTALLMLLPPIKRLTDITSTIQKGLASSEIIFGILEEKTERIILGEHIPELLQGNIAFRNVDFSYEGRENVITGLSLLIPEGMTYALVGKSGSGKTTVTSLLTSLYPPTAGQIKIGSTDLSTVPLSLVRKSIATVSQDVRLFNDTILNNIAYPEVAPNLTRAELSLKNAYAYDFVNSLPNGIHSQIGQNGITLSGGQRQRIAIARAFYKNAPILILDEATSALDTESERHIQEALENLIQNRTSIVIAHRLSTIENADQIIVMDEGRIVESGTHKELLAAEGFYANYYRLQFEATLDK